MPAKRKKNSEVAAVNAASLKKYVLDSTKPGALYSLHRLKKSLPPELMVGGQRSQQQRGKKPFSKELEKKLKHFYTENAVLRQFYGTSKIPRNKTVRNAVAAYPLERLHIDLAEFTAKHGKSDYRYLLVAVDNYSRYAFGVPLKSKRAGEMREAAENLLDQLRPFRHLTMSKHSLFMSDLVS